MTMRESDKATRTALAGSGALVMDPVVSILENTAIGGITPRKAKGRKP